MSILSKAKAAVKKVTTTVKKAASTAKSNLLGNLGVIGDKVVQSAKKAPSVASVASSVVNRIKDIPTKGGLLTPTSKSMNFPTLPGASWSQPSAGNQSIVKDSKGNYSVVSKSSAPQGPQTLAQAQTYSNSTSSRLQATPSYTPSLKDMGSAISTDDMTNGSTVTSGTGQTNAGITSVNAYTGVGDKVNAYISDYEKTLAERRAAAEKERDTTLEYIQKELGDAAEDTRIDRQDIEEQAGLKQAEQEANQIKSEILGIKAEFEAKRQSLIGQGRGIPEVIIGGQQEALDRQEAIKSMPLLARYQIATDNVTAAKETVANYIADEQAYLNRVYQTKVSVLNKAYDLAVGKEKDAVNDFKDAFTMQIKNQQDANDLKLKLINGYLDAGQTPPNSLLSYDTSSTTAQNDLMGYAGGIKPTSSGAGNLTTRQNINLSSITTKYQADETIKAAQNAISAREIADQVIANPGNAGNQLKILYTFIKSLDPESAVREGELSLAQNTQSYLSRFKTEIQKISQDKGISDSMATQLAQATKSLADQWTNAAQRRDNFYKSQANVLGVGEVFNEYLSGTQGPTQSSGGDDIDAFLDSF